MVRLRQAVGTRRVTGERRFSSFYSSSFHSRPSPFVPDHAQQVLARLDVCGAEHAMETARENPSQLRPATGHGRRACRRRPAAITHRSRSPHVTDRTLLGLHAQRLEAVQDAQDAAPLAAVGAHHLQVGAGKPAGGFARPARQRGRSSGRCSCENRQSGLACPRTTAVGLAVAQYTRATVGQLLIAFSTLTGGMRCGRGGGARQSPSHTHTHTHTVTAHQSASTLLNPASCHQPAPTRVRIFHYNKEAAEGRRAGRQPER